MSRENLGNKQTIKLHNCLIKMRYALVITPHRRIIAYIRSKRQTRKKTIITKEKQIIKRSFSKRQNAVSESKINSMQGLRLQDLKDSINMNNPIENQKYFSNSEATTPSSVKGKRRIKKSYISKPVRLHNWNQPTRHIESYTLTALSYKKKIEYNEHFDDNLELQLFIQPQSDPARGQVQFCHKLIVNVFEKKIAHENKTFLK